ncbi:major type 1 subunit fimbrin (pilin) [Cupriavidus sp. YR651]|uniref:fimbrial protein n=1 Tax=Cupriavidus sp. YR651 TaxID=1855315 RepID=UPI000884DE23|nr:fimbrial protein [Cupriavidus sp. YR651]SDC00632.1 major type 1 subunit fimbrin (pilin) [Cupriavidus sp. YR651]
MKRHAIALLIGAAAGLASSGAWAQAGVINITGALRGSTCKVNGTTPSGPSPVPVAVMMDTFATTSLRTAGDTTGLKGFRITLSDCDPATYKIKFDPSSATTVNTATGRLRNTTTGASAATLVEVEVLSNNLESINLLSNSGNTQEIIVPPPTGTSTVAAPFDFYVRYFATGAATAGAFTGTLPFSIQIN